MTTRKDNEHLSAERLQAFLEGELSKRELRHTEKHLERCARCSSELDAWRTVFADLGELRGLRPHEGFTDRVMMQVRIPEPQPLTERIREWVNGWLGAGATGHVEPELVQSFVDGALPRRQAVRVERHLDACGACADEARRWTDLFHSLDSLGELAPSEGFESAVMARVSLPEPARAPAAVPGLPSGAAEAARWLGRARTLVPQTRRAWAALSGAAVTPVVTFGLVVYAVFSHPALTAETLISYVWWQLGDLAAAAWSAGVGAAAQAIGALGLQGVLETMGSAPFTVAAATTAYSLLVVLALRVLYKNLVAARSVDISHA